MAKSTKKKTTKSKTPSVSIHATKLESVSDLRAEDAKKAEAERLRKRNLGYC